MAYLEQAYNAEAITPSDTDDLILSGVPINVSNVSSACIYVGTGGNLTVTMLGGQTVSFLNIPDGSFLPIQVRKVWASGTDAADLLALY